MIQSRLKPQVVNSGVESCSPKSCIWKEQDSVIKLHGEKPCGLPLHRQLKYELMKSSNQILAFEHVFSHTIYWATVIRLTYRLPLIDKAKGYLHLLPSHHTKIALISKKNIGSWAYSISLSPWPEALLYASSAI